MYKIKNFEKTGKKMYFFQKLFFRLIYIIIIPIMIINFIILIQSYIKPNEVPNFLGYKSFIIISKSMEPTIMTGDAIFIKEVPKEKIKINDIISFHDSSDINTHRIIEIKNERGNINYLTKGDNNKAPDREKVTYDKIEGVYQFKINGFGPVINMIKNKATLIILLIFLVLISVHQINMGKRRLYRKEKRYL